jgi:hypothetical protein
MQTSQPWAPLALKNYIDYLRNNVKYPPHTGFIPDYELVRSESLMRTMTLQGAERALITGTYSSLYEMRSPSSNIDITEDYAAEQSENAKMIVAEIQRQLDKWKAKKAENE